MVRSAGYDPAGRRSNHNHNRCAMQLPGTAVEVCLTVPANSDSALTGSRQRLMIPTGE